MEEKGKLGSKRNLKQRKIEEIKILRKLAKRKEEIGSG